jgi:menaquinone-specific isochorismate synthase
MFTAVPVISAHANLIQDQQELYQFLSACQEKSSGNGGSQLVSFSQKIDPIDPLAILEGILPANQLYFYWESRRQGEAILGYGVTKSLTIDSVNRFQESQKFIEECSRHTIQVGESVDSRPYWFCSFTFFANSRLQPSPFPSATIFLPQVQIVKKQGNYSLVINCSINPKINLKLLLEQISHNTQFIDRFKFRELQHIEKQTLSEERNDKNNPYQTYKSTVDSALKSIQSHRFSKLVLAHALEVTAPKNFQITACLSHLRNHHPDCTIFSVSNGKGYHFIGASPERLISIHNQQLITDALAGSAPRGKNNQEDKKLAQKLLKSDKERREHQAVSDFINHKLYQLGLIPHSAPLQLLKLSNIQHLWTPIYAEIKPHIHPLQIIAQLHPTPAVAGVPSEIACEQIRLYETFERGLYAAPLGWIDSQGNSEFIVGIRSALIQGNYAQLYAGAGIVAGSNPNKELAEIQLKFQALMKSLL